MPKTPSIATQRKLLKLEHQVFALKQQNVRIKAKYERQIATLNAEIRKLKTQPLIISEDQQREIQERTRQLLQRT